ncbi:unnamed protein product [Effrenium voratum]|uniref:Uncharacterized protein n=1 Tax=Effrenium voratum TaxID=2562239 RepID=A0AA36IS78_9DINO|nr:unnamed protein product [Effrenium voratum]CAJ1455818.1 unnamed protein product [Effrenium voratum]
MEPMAFETSGPGTDSADFYRTLADELSTLSRLSAEIQWAPDVPLRAKRESRAALASTPAPTGRLPRPAAKAPAKGPPPARPAPAPVAPPAVAPNTAALATEVSTKKPAHLSALRTRPLPSTAGRTGRGNRQPTPSGGAAASGAGSLGRRLRLGAASQR